MTIWAIAGVLALAGLVLLAVSALKLLSGVRDVRLGLDRLTDRAEQAQQLQERLDATLAEAQRIASDLPRK